MKQPKRKHDSSLAEDYHNDPRTPDKAYEEDFGGCEWWHEDEEDDDEIGGNFFGNIPFNPLS